MYESQMSYDQWLWRHTTDQSLSFEHWQQAREDHRQQWQSYLARRRVIDQQLTELNAIRCALDSFAQAHAKFGTALWIPNSI